MKRFIIIALIALIAVAVVLFIFRPELIGEIWLWIVGLIGVIIGYSKALFDKFKKWTTEKPEDEKPGIAPENSLPEENTVKTTLNLLRIADDGNLTSGVLYFEDEFFCYTLEDSKGSEEISSSERLLQGKYPLGFDYDETDFALKYRLKYNWFNSHIQIKNTGTAVTYIHCGCTNAENINGILLPEDLFETFYKKITELENAGEPVFIQIYNENWFSDRFY